MIRTEKTKKLKQLKVELKNAKGIYFTDFTNISASDLAKMRLALKQKGVKMAVVKNKLCLMALEDFLFLESIKKFLQGPTALLLAHSDPIIPAKLMRDFKKLKFKGSIIENNLFIDKDLNFLANIPSQVELFGQLISAILLPITGLIYFLEMKLTELVIILEELKNKKTV